MSKMYEGVKTWNPIVGCEFDCKYCIPSFRRQAKRRRPWCELCYSYKPHFHPERLKRLPNSRRIFVCAYGDIAWAEYQWVKTVFEVIEKHPDRDFYIQSKNPSVFVILESEFEIPDNVVLGTTVETDLSTFVHEKYPTYHDISNAPLPEDRITAMKLLKHHRKYITIEPILDFSTPSHFARLIKSVEPEFIYVGYDNHNCRLPEPPLTKTLDLLERLDFTEVRLKTIRKARFTTEERLDTVSCTFPTEVHENG
ncbi:DUF5131 family protein [Archaeoglobus neptunius]|uniref:DUF5131 family protein n=1 Tax=Archaeoglobus neptunius TaxID=2798580 RepID=UPI001925FDA8|nr:DUF5131 family protein [Archaeoglobus neptunius]